MFGLKLDKKTLLIVVLMIALALMVCGYSQSEAQLSQFKSQISKFELSEQKFLEIIDEKGKRVVEQEQVILSQSDAIDYNLLEIDRLKKVSAQVIVNTITQIDSIFIPFVEDIVLEADTNGNDTLVGESFISVPQRFSLSDEWYSLSGVVKSNGLLMDSISFNTEVKITIGDKSVGLFRKPQPVILLEYDNPYVSTTGLQNIVIKNELKWYDKKTTWFSVGVGVGLGTAILLSK